MEKIIKNRSAKLVFSLVFLTLAYASCKKDKTEMQSKSGIVGTSISAAKESFENNSKIIEPNYTGQSFLSKDLLGKRKLDWDNAFSQSNGDTVAVFVPVKLDARITLVDGGLPGARLDNLLYLRLMTTSKAFDGSKAEMISMIPDQIWEKGKNFSGHMFIENWFVPNISVVSRTKNSTIPTNIGSKKPGDKVVNGFMDCYTATETACVGVGGGETCVTNTTTVCVGGGGNGGNPGGGDGGGGTGTPGGAGGSGGGNPNNQRDTSNNVKNNCIKSALSLALNRNVKNEVKELMSNTFLTGHEFNLAFSDYPFTNTKNTEAYTGFSSLTNRHDIFISFNSNTMPNNSQEYNVATIYHEILHAYFNVLYGIPEPGNPMLVPEHHEYIADNYVNMLTKDLMSIFPNLSESDARNLSWGGLQNTNVYKRLLPATQNEIIRINTLYSTKSTNSAISKGNYCP